MMFYRLDMKKYYRKKLYMKRAFENIVLLIYAVSLLLKFSCIFNCFINSRKFRLQITADAVDRIANDLKDE